MGRIYQFFGYEGGCINEGLIQKSHWISKIYLHQTKTYIRYPSHRGLNTLGRRSRHPRCRPCSRILVARGPGYTSVCFDLVNHRVRRAVPLCVRGETSQVTLLRAKSRVRNGRCSAGPDGWTGNLVRRGTWRGVVDVVDNTCRALVYGLIA